MKRNLMFLAAFSAVFACVDGAKATTLVNDTWLDGSDTDPAAPTYSESGVDLDLDGDLESVWYRGGAGTFDPVGAGGPLRADLSSAPTSQSSWTTYFTPEATPVSLEVGQRLKITWAFTPSGLSVNASQGLRIGVLKSPSGSRLTSDLSPGSAAYSGYSTFINMTSGNFGHTDPFQLKERSDASTAGGVLSNAGLWATMGIGYANGASIGNSGFSDNVPYTYTFEATRISTDKISIMSRMAGDGLDGDGVAQVALTDWTPNGGSFSFDTFAIRASNANSSATIFDTSLFKVEVDQVDIVNVDPSPYLTADGSLGAQTDGGVLSNPWQMSSGNVSVKSSSQSPFSNVFLPNDRGIHSEQRSLGPKFFTNSVVGSPVPADSQETLYFNVDFRNTSTDEMPYNLFVASGELGQSPSLGMYINGNSLYGDNGESFELLSPLDQGTWYNLQLELNLATDTYSGTLTPFGGESVAISPRTFKGADLPIGSIGHDLETRIAGFTGDTPTHDIDNFVLSAVPFTAPSIPGDFNGDGYVDGGDLDVWKEHYSMPSGASHQDGDADGNGTVDGNDFLVWQRNYTGSAPQTSVSIPEPVSFIPLAVSGGALVASRRRYRASR